MRYETAGMLASQRYTIPKVQVKESDAVNHPAHYTSSTARCAACGHSIECIDVVEHMTFSLGNCIKYLWRAGLKGSAVEDLKKARWYVSRQIERLERGGST